MENNYYVDLLDYCLFLSIYPLHVSLGWDPANLKSIHKIKSNVEQITHLSNNIYQCPSPSQKNSFIKFSCEVKSYFFDEALRVGQITNWIHYQTSYVKDFIEHVLAIWFLRRRFCIKNFFNFFSNYLPLGRVLDLSVLKMIWKLTCLVGHLPTSGVINREEIILREHKGSRFSFLHWRRFLRQRQRLGDQCQPGKHPTNRKESLLSNPTKH